LDGDKTRLGCRVSIATFFMYYHRWLLPLRHENDSIDSSSLFVKLKVAAWGMGAENKQSSTVTNHFIDLPKRSWKIIVWVWVWVWVCVETH